MEGGLSTPPALKEVAALDADRAWAVGSGGAVYVTGDGGVTWIPRDAGTEEDLLAVSAVPGAEEASGCVWAAGRRGVLLRSVDGGGWERLEAGTGRDILDIAAVDADAAWAVAEGSLVLRTVDGGANWEHLDTGNLNPLRCVLALDRERALLAGENGTVLLTTDGGATWHLQATGTADHLVALAISRREGGGTIYALGDTGMLALAEFSFAPHAGEEAGGPGSVPHEDVSSTYAFSWSAADTGVEAAPRALCAAGETVWVGGRGFIRRGTGGGEHWETLDPGTRGEINSLFALDHENLWAVGEEGLAMRSYDGGRTWVPQFVPRGKTLLDVWALDAQTAWAVGEGGEALATADGGFTWSVLNPGAGGDIYAVAGAGADHIWLAGAGGMVLRSWNGGRSWEEQPSRTAYDLLDLHAVDAKTAWAVGRRGVLIRTFDEGYTWYRLDRGEGPDLTGIWAGDAATAWAVSREGTVLRIREEGREQEWVETGAPGALRAICGACSEGGTVLLAVGDEATVLRSADGGSTWTELEGLRSLLEEDSRPDLFGVSMADDRHAWICGEDGFLARTSDGGSTWERVETGGGAGLYGIASPEAETVWSAGWRGTMIHRRSSPRLDAIIPAEAEAEQTVTLTGLAFGPGGAGSAVVFGEVKAGEYRAWSDRLIKVDIPTEASVREEVKVITPRGTSAPRTITVFPSLKGVSPRYCRPGDLVTLSGASFGRTRGDSFVSVGKARIQEYEYWSNNYIRFRMPGGQPPVVEVSVTTPAGASRPLKVRVMTEFPPSPSRAGPRVHGVDPLSAPAGAEVRVLGSGFGPSRNGSYVTFGGVMATDYLSWREDMVVVRVPSGAAGTVELRVVVGSNRSNPVSFRILARPLIRGLNPTSGPPGSRVEVVGEWFGDREGPECYLSFGGVRIGVYEYWSADRILFRVPADASGEVPVVVTTSTGSSEPVVFRVRRPHLWGVAALGGRAVAVGEDGAVLLRENEGSDWKRVESGISLNLYAVSAADSLTAWAVGEGGVILKTSDGGATWTPQDGGGAVTWRAVCASGTQRAWVAGSCGAASTLDGGRTWATEPTARADYRGICVFGRGALAVGLYGSTATLRP